MCLLWLRIGNKWGDIARFIGYPESAVKRGWKSLLASENLKESPVADLKKRIRKIVEKLKSEIQLDKDIQEKYINQKENIRDIMQSSNKKMKSIPVEINSAETIRYREKAENEQYDFSVDTDEKKEDSEKLYVELEEKNFADIIKTKRFSI